MDNVTVTSRPTIRQVAELAGVSRMTVSRVLSDRSDQVAEPTRQRVLEVVRELEYVPVPQPMVHSRHIETRILGLVFDGTPLEGQWGLPTFWGMREAATKHDYDLLTLLRVRPDWMIDKEELQFLDRRSDGFIFVAPQNRRQTLETLVRHQLPAVACFTTDVPSSVPTIVLDNFGALQKSVQHLISRGHQRILHLTTSHQRSDFLERRRGYEQAMQTAGLEPLVLADNRLLTTGDADPFIEAVRRHRITAVACANDSWATYVLDAAQAKGLKIPEDLSVIGMDDLAEPAKRGLTSIRFSCEEIGRRAVEAIVDLKQGGDGKSVNPVVPVELVERSSVAPPP